MARALARLEAVGLGRDDWIWGGGTVLMLRYKHRLSRDIDLFINDVQYLSYLSPRLSDHVERDIQSYSEQANHLRLEYPEGEVDFLAVAPVFPDAQFDREHVDGIDGTLRLMTDKEILGQKLHYRAAAFAGRDLYDFVVVAANNPALLLDAGLRGVASGRRDALMAALSSKSCELGYAAIERPALDIPFTRARQKLFDWLA
jgi:hypothetical protein